MSKLSYHYPLVIRLWHILNTLCILLLIATGISMYYADPGRPLIEFSWAVKLHNFTGIILSFSYLVFFFFNLFTENGSHYKTKWKGLIGRLMKQGMYYMFGMFKGRKNHIQLQKRENSTHYNISSI